VSFGLCAEASKIGCVLVARTLPGIPDRLKRKSRCWPDLVCLESRKAIMEKHDDYLEMRLKIEAVFEHYAEQSEYYKRANIAQRFAIEDAFYRLSMELLAKIIGSFDA
jgi:hypothetical protein